MKRKNNLPLIKLLNLTALFAAISLVVFIPLLNASENSPLLSQSQLSTTVSPRLSIPISDSTPVASISAQSAFIYDPDSKTTLYQKNSHQEMHPASLTKIMTALVALDIYQPDEILTVKSAASSIDNSVHLVANDQLTVENLLYAALVASTNDAALVLAENHPQVYSQFIDRMNQKANLLGLKNTHFANVTGFENKDNKSTARDLTLLTAFAVKNPLIAKIVNTKSITITNHDQSRQYQVQTTNHLLGQDGVIGVKTGTTLNAGQNLITLANRNGKSIITTVLNSKNRFSDSRLLINWAFNHHTWQDF